MHLAPRYDSMDCLKALGAFLVVTAHCYDTWNDWGYLWLFPIIRMSMPFFFMISGFFLYSDDREKALRKCRRAFVRIFWITVFANLFYYLTFYVPHDILPLRKAKEIVAFLVFGTEKGVFQFHLWYLNAYLETLLVMMVALKLRWMKGLWLLIVPGILMGLLFGKYELAFQGFGDGIAIDRFMLTRNALTLSIPCVALGWAIAKYRVKLLELVKRPLLTMLVILALGEAEVYLLRLCGSPEYGEYLLCSIPLGAVMMVTAVKWPHFGRGSWVAKIGLRYSLGIYVYHAMFLRLLPSYGLDFLYEVKPLLSVEIFLITLGFTALWRKASERIF